MKLDKKELELISLALFKLKIDKKTLLGDRTDEDLIKMIDEIEKLSSKIDTKRVSK